MALNPFLSSQSHPGRGEVRVSLLPPNVPAFEILRYAYPLKLISSAPHVLSRESQHAMRTDARGTELAQVPLLFMLTYGGGLLPKDLISLHVTLEPATRLTIATQGSTKVFPSAAPEKDATITGGHLSCSHTASQHLNVHLEAGSALLLSPDPVQPFKNSHYSQVQIFTVYRDASLALLDWITSGRPSREEIWDAGSWTGRNEIWHTNDRDRRSDAHSEGRRKLLIRDALYLEDGPTGISMRSLKEERKGVYGTFVLVGPVFARLSDFFLLEFAIQPKLGGFNWDDEAKGERDMGDTKNEKLEQWRRARYAQERSQDLLWTVAQVRGVTIVKFAAENVDGAKVWLNNMLACEGSIEQDFGPGGLLSVR